MIFFDQTKAAVTRHRSGLARMNERLRDEMGRAVTGVPWTEARDRAGSDDWFLTSELFSEQERPGIGEFLRGRRCRAAAIFADAIPLKHPHITWPQSVARHPSYLKLLARFDRVWAISAASRDELLGYWRWLGLEQTPSVRVLPLGADLAETARSTHARAPSTGIPALLCVGILEPRKNQGFLLDVGEGLWRSGARFELHLVGRVNPHFGRPLVERIKMMRKEFSGLHFHEAADDATLQQLWARARATVFPTIAEGCGLPLLESLWAGVPCICSDLPVLRENADGGGCVAVPVGDAEAWVRALHEVVVSDALHRRLAVDAMTRALPTWAETARVLVQDLN